jgi:hypothetical protein
MMNEEERGLYVVTFTDSSGVAQTVATPSRNDAICYFMKMAYLFSHAMEEVPLRVVGLEGDQPHSGLHLIAELTDGPIEVMGLTKAVHVEAKPGWYPPDHSSKSFEDLALAMDAAVVETKGHLEPNEKVRLRESAAAVAVRTGLASGMIAEWRGKQGRVQASDVDASRCWKSMSEVKQLLSMWAAD